MIPSTGRLGIWCLGAAFVLGLFSLPTRPAERFDVLIKNAKIVDGTGRPAFKGNVAIKGEKILAVGNVSGDAELVVDAQGLVVCPGFIDPHSHADLTIMDVPLAENLIMQGITTFVGGNCSQSPAPRKDLTFADWLSKVEKKGISPNYVPLVGHDSLRELALGPDLRRTATPSEIEVMKKYAEEAMKSGAFGLSSFGDPAASHFASLDELVELARVVRQHGGFYVPHTRGIQSQWPTDDPERVSYELYLGPPEYVMVGTYLGYLEAFEISRRAQIPVHIVHLSTAYRIHQPHPDYLDEAAAKATLELIDKARNEGLDVTFDVIVYAGSISAPEKLVDAFYSERVGGLSWVREIAKDDFISRLKTREFRNRVRKIHDSCRLKFGMVHTKVDPFWFDCFKIVKSQKPDYPGKTIGEIAALKKADPLETVFELLVEDPNTVWIQFLDRRGTEAINSVFIKHPLAMPCTDIAAVPANPEKPETMAPITYSVYPNYFSNYVREKKVLSLEEAVKKATASPAQWLGIKDRGVLKVGAYADIVVFDFQKIKPNATPLEPTLAPDGIEYVLVNGKVVYREKSHTGATPGKVLRRS